MINTVIGRKTEQSQRFLEDGRRIPVTFVSTGGNPVVQIKRKDKDGYWSLQLSFGNKKRPSKALMGHVKGANLEKSAPSYLREVRLTGDVAEDSLPKVGDVIKATDVLKPGDTVDVLGVSKGKGYAGVVKRHHFKGGPRTHGQSDRERAPGSIGQTTTPGRVYKGKRMAGRMGSENVTIKNLEVIAVEDDKITVKGLVPGSVNSIVLVRKVGENKKFVPLVQTEAEKQVLVKAKEEALAAEAKAAEEAAVIEEVKEEEIKVEAKTE